MSASTTAILRHDWSLAEVKALFVQPFNDLLFQAQTVHRAHFDANRVQVSTLLSIKNRRLPGRLQILSAVRPLQHWPGKKEKN